MDEIWMSCMKILEQKSEKLWVLPTHLPVTISKCIIWGLPFWAFLIALSNLNCKHFDLNKNKYFLNFIYVFSFLDEMFLSGPLSLVTIENPKCTSGKELIIFRDSFASSIAPLLAEGYTKITLADIRYLRSDFLDRFIAFKDQDVLFLYSTLVLNNSKSLS